MINNTFISIHKRRKFWNKVDNKEREVSKLYPAGRCSKEVFICRYFKQAVDKSKCYKLIVNNEVYVGYLLDKNIKDSNKNKYHLGVASFMYKRSDDFQLHFYDFARGILDIEIGASSDVSFSELDKKEIELLGKLYGITMKDKKYHDAEVIHDLRTEKSDKSPLFKSLVKFRKNICQKNLDLMKNNIENDYNIIVEPPLGFDHDERHYLKPKTKKIPNNWHLAQQIYQYLIRK